MPNPRFLGTILRKAVDRLSWPPGKSWKQLTRAQQGELTVQQVQTMVPRLTHKPLMLEHPEDREKVKIGEITHNYQAADGSWKVVFEINDGTPFGKSIADQVRTGKLSGLSLAHDTVELAPTEVSLVVEGFRYDTGVDGEMPVGAEPQAAPSNPEQYISPGPEDQSTVFKAGAPRIIHAGLFKMNQMPPQPDGYHHHQQQQQQQLPYPQQQQQQFQPPQQQHMQAPAPLPPSAAAAPPLPLPQASSSSSAAAAAPPPPPGSQAVSLENSKELVERFMQNSYLPANDKKQMMELLTKLAKDKKMAEASLEMHKQQGNDSLKLFDHMLRTILSQHDPKGVPTTGPEAEQDKKTSEELIAKDQKAYMNFMMPKLIRASARLNGGGGSSSDYGGQQQQYGGQGPLDHPVPAFDPELWAHYQSYREVVSNDFMPQTQQQAQPPRQMYASNNYNNNNSYGISRYHPYSAPPASSHQQQQQSRSTRGVGGWLNHASLLPSTVAVFNETQAAAQSGFGDTFRLADVMGDSSTKRQYLPPASEMGAPP